ncbi:Signal transducer regulating beta-lactamase production, contains metallopeptidase domain [Butyrivibrio proteoclasticus]|uniref:Signal transducer regulating beta-lactamase production, contains metallopeptidase domain n=1 Tax=Butyrivibrio proteoclasticus TaxID=43305 RepID=A0A1I5WSJ5_9FIRM|nr:M56 family metallopeptidase [Butyrivibrio proteoclasticus]SFQ22733.1 Signal transducer regulating beta-lactamase production, contains metallopeptidase domain [Butyrivibrio proteoclasticus]
MSALFLKILNLSINASWLILAVIAARLLLKKAPRWISCLLWGLVAVRLLCPISLESVLSILPSAKVVPDNIEMVQNPHIDSGVRIIDNAVNPVIEKSFSPDAASSVNPMQVVVFVGSILWLTGMVVMLLYALISYILLRRKVRASVSLNGSVKECDEVDSPFILGIFRPEIYVPSGIDENTLELVIAHEEAHLKRHDHWWKPFGFVLLAVYWFNPLCWVAYILLCRDIEAACDEKVIKDKDREYMVAYSQALLDCSVNRRIITACPLAFGETGVKERVRGVLNYKKPAFWVIIVAVIACIVVVVCFMTNPAKRITLPDDPVVFSVHDNPDGYIEYHWEEKGLVYVPYMPLDPELAGDCIGYDELEGELESYVCKVKGLSETEWICDVSSETVNGHTAGMIMREINVKKVPEGWESEYEWNIPYTDYVGDVPTVTEIARRLPYPDDYQYDHIEIQSGEEPYGLTVFLKGKPSIDATQFQTAANRAFESIGNLGSITFSVIDSEEKVSFLANENITTENTNTDESVENLGIEYEYVGGSYVVEGDMVFAYKKELSGRTPNAAYDTKYIVLTNNEDITFEQVDRSFYSSNSADFLRDTIVIGMHLIDEQGNIVSMTDIPALGRGEVDNPIGLQMYVKDVTPTGCTLVFSQTGGDVTGELQTGAFYEIQIKNEEWINKSYAIVEWIDIAYKINKEGITELPLEWESIYGSLQDGHYRIHKTITDFRGAGDYDEYDVYAEFDIGDNTTSTESVTDWMDITLPSGYSISSFDDAIGYMGGSLILPRSYYAEDSEYGPLEWQYSGLISRLPADSGMATVTFDNGIPDPSSMPRDNHTDAEYLKTIGLERSNTQWSAVMLKENHDLYTASQLSEMKDEGIDLTRKELTSDYWSFWFVKEGEDTYYLLTLSAKEFTQEEAEKIARTVSIK